MTETQLQEIEAKLEVTLPEIYRVTVLSPPFRPIGNDWVYWLYDDPERIIEESKLRYTFDGAPLASWRPTNLVFGQTPGGDLYFIDTTRKDSPVYCLSHEDDSIVEEYVDFDAYLKDSIQIYEEMLRGEPAMQESIRRTQRGAGIAIGVIFVSILLVLVMLIVALLRYGK